MNGCSLRVGGLESFKLKLTVNTVEMRGITNCGNPDDRFEPLEVTNDRVERL